MTYKKKYKVIIVGTGFSGICAAYNLKKIGITDFLMLDKEDQMGGTWYANKYPGAAVDVQSYLYSLSFEPYNWSRVFAKKEEILDYTNYVIDKHGLREKTKLNTEVIKQEYVDDLGIWLVYTKEGEIFECDYIFNAYGILVKPMYPAINGMEEFKGKQVHSAKWDSNYDIKNKRIAVIGSAASAVQIIPSIAEDVQSLHVFQRTPHWVMKKPDRAFKEWEKKLLNNKIIRHIYREILFWTNEYRMLGFAKFPIFMKLPELVSRNYINKSIKDKELRKKVTPNFKFGCKRVLLTSDYYSALQKNNVALQTEGIKEINKYGIILPNGEQINLDAIIYCTGFEVANYIPFDVFGKNGVSIKERFKNGLQAYLGSFIPNFPKIFVVLGPNTAVGHTSALHIMESQISLAMKCIKEAESKNWKSFDIKESVDKEYNEDLQKKMQRTIWVVGGCKSWYQDIEGKNRTIFPDFNFKFRSLVKNFNFNKFNIEKR